MPIYEAQDASLSAVPVTSFAALGWKERGDLQRRLLHRVAALEEGLLILAEEYSGWEGSARRIDLLGLDPAANLVVIELKRDEDGGHMELQALRYAAMVSVMTFEQAVATLARHRDRAAPDEEGARKTILDHLGWREPDETAFAGKVRIILAAADFGREITTTVLWLRDAYGMDIRCTRLRPHRLDDGRVLLDVQRLIPLPEAADFQIRIEAKQAAVRKEQSGREVTLGRFLDQLAERATARTDLHAGRVPQLGPGAILGRVGRAGIGLNYVIARDRSRVEILNQRDDAQEWLRQMQQYRADLEAAFGGELEWAEKEGIRQCRVLFTVEGGYLSPESEWPGIHDRLIDAMVRLERTFRPHLAALSGTSDPG